MVTFPAELKNFVDAEGRLRQWPTKQKLQLLAIPALAEAIPSGQRFTEREVNELLNRYHTFGDPALLRRLLCDMGYLARERDGSVYWRVAQQEASEG